MAWMGMGGCNLLASLQLLLLPLKRLVNLPLASGQALCRGITMLKSNTTIFHTTSARTQWEEQFVRPCPIPIQNKNTACQPSITLSPFKTHSIEVPSHHLSKSFKTHTPITPSLAPSSPTAPHSMHLEGCLHALAPCSCISLALLQLLGKWVGNGPQRSHYGRKDVPTQPDESKLARHGWGHQMVNGGDHNGGNSQRFV